MEIYYFCDFLESERSIEVVIEKMNSHDLKSHRNSKVLDGSSDDHLYTTIRRTPPDGQRRSIPQDDMRDDDGGKLDGLLIYFIDNSDFILAYF